MNTTTQLQYYLIHNMDPERKQIMTTEFVKWGFDQDKITWLNHPNKDELTQELIEKLVLLEPSYSSGVFIHQERTLGMKGLISCTYKHYLALLDIIKRNYDYGVIIEDNIQFTGSLPEMIPTYIEQLDSIFMGEWDILFIGYLDYIESPHIPGLFVYPKSNEVTMQCHGGTNSANCYIIRNSCARKLAEHYLPFNNSPDWWMNTLFRKLNIKSFWAVPTLIYMQPGHVSTTLEP